MLGRLMWSLTFSNKLSLRVQTNNNLSELRGTMNFGQERIGGAREASGNAAGSRKARKK